MRAAWLALLILALPATLAAQQPAPAPKPGHPLDPADVVTLSAKPQGSGYAYPSPYVSYPVDGRWYGNSYYDAWSTETSPPFMPLVFGRIGDRPVVLFTSTNREVPPLFYGSGRTFFYAPARPALFGSFGTFGR